MLNILKISVSIDKCIKLSTFKKIKHLKITVHFTHTHTHTHTLPASGIKKSLFDSSQTSISNQDYSSRIFLSYISMSKQNF